MKRLAADVLAPRSDDAESAERDQLETAYCRFVSESDPAHKEDVGKELIRAVFGEDAIAER